MIEVSIIVPALNEAENLPPLMARIDAALRGRAYEVIVVDDNSQDGTRGVCAELARQLPVSLLVREQPKHGLSGAVICGMGIARGQYLVVIDADLQHPPEQIPTLLEPLRAGEADFTLGSRYVHGGSMEAAWGLFRRLNSWIATALARPFAGRVSDPMSGFFALPRTAFVAAAPRLNPLGYKIALELMCKCRVSRVREIPIHFSLRRHGESKLTIHQQFRYLEHLSRLYDFFFPRLSPIAKFLIVIAASWAPAMAVEWILLNRRDGGGLVGGSPVMASLVASLVATAITAVFHCRYVRTQREFLVRPRPWLDFAVIASAELAMGAIAVFWLVTRIADAGIGEILVLHLSVCVATRYLLRKELLQDLRGLGATRRPAMDTAPATAHASERSRVMVPQLSR